MCCYGDKCDWQPFPCSLWWMGWLLWLLVSGRLSLYPPSGVVCRKWKETEPTKRWVLVSTSYPSLPIECVHMTSRRPCWRPTKKRRPSWMSEIFFWGFNSIFLCKFLLLFHYANMAFGHMSEHTLLFPSVVALLSLFQMPVLIFM